MLPLKILWPMSGMVLGKAETPSVMQNPIVILLRRADLPFPRSSILKMKGFA
jgi:hypothetical protein